MSQVTYPLGMPKELLKEVKDAAEETGLSSADVMRQAIKFGIARVRRSASREEDFSKAADIRGKIGPGRGTGVMAKLVKKGGRLTFQLPKGCKIAPHGIEEAIREERER